MLKQQQKNLCQDNTYIKFPFLEGGDMNARGDSSFLRNI